MPVRQACRLGALSSNSTSTSVSPTRKRCGSPMAAANRRSRSFTGTLSDDEIARAAGLQGIRVEKPTELESAFGTALAHRGPSLVEVITDPNALSIPPEIKSSQVFGFATAMSRIVLNRGAGEAVSMARSNLRNIPRG